MSNITSDLNLFITTEETQFQNSVESLMYNVFGEDTNVVVSNDYFVLMQKNISVDSLRGIDQSGRFSIGTNDYKLLSDVMLDSRNLLLGKIVGNPTRVNHAENNTEKMFVFRKGLLLLEQAWLKAYADHIKLFLADRISEGTPIIKYEAVRLTWADLIECLESLNKAIISLDNNNSHLTRDDIFELSRKHIRKACEHLAKLAGGRAYLAGQAVEMLWLFEVLNKIYFKEGE